MIPARFRNAEGACELGYYADYEPCAEKQPAWLLGFFAALLGFSIWFWRRPRPSSE